MNSIDRRRGFTLIELLVVIGIIGLLMALILPAVQQAREAARRATCASQLKNIGLAVHHHADGHNAFPAGSGSSPLGASYLLQILPYMEQLPLYNTINVTTSGLSNENLTVIFLTPGIFLCPSDTRRETNESAVAVNYPGNAGHDSLHGEGVFIGRPLAARDITDGLSSTAGVAEWVVESGTSRYPSRLGASYQLRPRYSGAPVDHDAFLRACDALDPAQILQVDVYKGFFWVEGGLKSSSYNHESTPNRPTCSASIDLNTWPAGGFHVGGVHVLTMDGGVHFIRDSVDPRLWAALGTRSGQEAVSDGSF